MIDSPNFYSQLWAFEDPLLRRLTCGVTSAAMVISRLGNLGEYVLDKNLERFLDLIVKGRKTTREILCRPFTLAGNQALIPIAYGDLRDNEITSDVVVLPPNADQYLPTYSLRYGYDHRCSAWLFQQFGFHAGLVTATFDEVYSMFRTGKLAYFLPSTVYVNPVSGGIGSHIVVVEEVTQRVVYTDPVKVSYADARTTMPAAGFAEIYRGYGTAIYA